MDNFAGHRVVAMHSAKAAGGRKSGREGQKGNFIDHAGAVTFQKTELTAIYSISVRSDWYRQTSY